MLLDPLRVFLLESPLPKKVDGVKIWQAIKDAPVNLIDTLPEFAQLMPLATADVTAPQVIVMPQQNTLCVTALVDVVQAGLVPLLEQQLSYVPRLAVLEWYLSPPQIGVRDVVICIGHAAVKEPLNSAVTAPALLSSGQVPNEVVETLQHNPQSTKIWLFSLMPSLRSRGILGQENLALAGTPPVWRLTVNVPSSSVIH